MKRTYISLYCILFLTTCYTAFSAASEESALPESGDSVASEATVLSHQLSVVRDYVRQRFPMSTGSVEKITNPVHLRAQADVITDRTGMARMSFTVASREEYKTFCFQVTEGSSDFGVITALYPNTGHTLMTIHLGTRVLCDPQDREQFDAVDVVGYGTIYFNGTVARIAVTSNDLRIAMYAGQAVFGDRDAGQDIPVGCELVVSSDGSESALDQLEQSEVDDDLIAEARENSPLGFFVIDEEIPTCPGG